jgi:hypothetical protein
MKFNRQEAKLFKRKLFLSLQMRKYYLHAPKESHTFKNCTHGLGKTTHKFKFSRIFDSTTTQKDFFQETMLDLVKDFIDGQNCLVFTYGVTSSGKTYTIQGTIVFPFQNHRKR